ncbi:MAG TPA: carboxypeptidase-like regulatory domain-containing protein [Flavobacteriaceae bacterium]|nr:carboxypeptidase-like regulatory domain-containing protein [Flavobacteriaceae bacterium]
MKRFLFLLLIVFCFVSISCENEPADVNPIEENNNQNNNNSDFDLSENFGAEVTRAFLGRVIDKNHNPIENASIKIGSSTTTTDENGIFIVPDAEVHENFAYITATKPGFTNGSRAVVPSNGTNKITIMLLDATVIGAVQSGNTESISMPNGASVTLAGEYITESGDPYSGSVDVIMHHLDPAETDMPLQMPGMLYAANSENEERMLQSYGMLSVELRGSGGETLNLAEGSTAEIKMPLSADLLAAAPSTIPLWHFDENKGYWIEDGEAVLQGNAYVGSVSHFSFWNVDMPFPTVNLCIVLTDMNGNPLANSWISLTHSNSTYPYPMATGITNANGEVCGLIPANELLDVEIHAFDLCESFEFNTSLGPYSNDSSETISMNIDPSTLIAETVQGNFNDCGGNPVTNGYVKMEYGPSTYYDMVDDGSFEINLVHCPGPTNFSIEAVDYNSQQTTGEINYGFTTPITSLGVLSACTNTTEMIYFSIDNGDTEGMFINDEISTNFNVADPANGNQPTISIFAQGGSTGCFVMTGVLNNAPYEGTYDFLNINTPVTGFYFPDCDPYVPYENNNSTIEFNLTNLGDIGEYIDINFSGSYNDYEGNPRTLTGIVHVIRTN